ncbi:MAG: shikimate kinase [Coriobacteriia bacterium]|nr:shikimate kinase [Coriobacteriia bacterium]
MTCDNAPLAVTVAFIGFMGAGKTSVAAELSERLRVAFIDIDQEVETYTGMTITEIFERNGERFFRGLETELLEDALNGAPALIACGGGVVLDPKNVERLKESAFTIYLQMSADQIELRLEDYSTRPLIQAVDGPQEIAEMMVAREELYEIVADRTVDTSGLTLDEVCDQIEKLLKEADSGIFHA